MALTTAFIEASYRKARTALSGAAAVVRFGGREYTGVRASIEQSDRPGARGSLEGTTGAVRLLVSELGLPRPDAGDVIQIKEPISTGWESRRVLSARYDQVGATVRLDYTGEHA